VGFIEEEKTVNKELSTGTGHPGPGQSKTAEYPAPAIAFQEKLNAKQ
jgi:hypothetical protein